MKCVFCGTEMECVTRSVETKWGSYDIVIKGITAYVCKQCGKEVYESDDIRNILEMPDKLTEAAKTPPPPPESQDTAKTSFEVERCDWCDGLHIRCQTCGIVTSISEYGKVVECRGGCGLKLIAHMHYIGDGMYEEEVCEADDDK